MVRSHNNLGFTLLELLIGIAILGIIMIGLNQALGTAVSSYGVIKQKQDLLAQARYAMERVVMFTQETDSIQVPSSDRLIVHERVLDTYNNGDHTYLSGGDGYLDADNDSDGLINEGGADSADLVTFDLNKADPNNWKLQEQMPDYSTAALADFMAVNVICEHVTSFSCNLLATNLVEIQLTVNDGNKEVSLKTRARAMYVE